MSFASLAHHSARIVRTTTIAGAVILLVAVLALQAFHAEYGQGQPIKVMDVGETDPALGAAIRQQESTGLQCSSQPALTDVIVFQDALGGDVSIVTFDQALAASRAKVGRVLSYCV